jgi:preprotein translocase subunit SecE
VTWPIVVGAVVAVFSRFAAGVQQGLSWLTGVQTGAFENANAGFGESLEPLRGLDFTYLIGLGLVGLGAVAFLVRVIALSIGRGAPATPSETGFVVYPLGGLLRNAVAVFVLAAVAAFAFPAIDSGAPASVLADATRNFAGDPVSELGREVYVREGCWYCHTQQVRQVRTDVGLGPVSQPGDYAYDPAGLAGARRIGPDLTHQGSRQDTGSAAWVRLHLSDPRADHPWSVMPSFDYLSEEELTALSVYVSGLE